MMEKPLKSCGVKELSSARLVMGSFNTDGFRWFPRGAAAHRSLLLRRLAASIDRDWLYLRHASMDTDLNAFSWWITRIALTTRFDWQHDFLHPRWWYALFVSFFFHLLTNEETFCGFYVKTIMNARRNSIRVSTSMYNYKKMGQNKKIVQ